MAKRRNTSKTRRGDYEEDYGVIRIPKRALAIGLGVFVLLLGVAATVFCWGARDSAGNWAANPTITEWFDYWGKGAPNESDYETQKTIVLQESGLFVLTTRNAAATPIAMYTVQAQANANTATLTAKLTPENADYSAVNWTCSDRAVQLTKDDINPLQVQVALVGELFYTATITCEVVSVTTLKGTCTVDYMHYAEEINAYSSNLKFGSANEIILSPKSNTSGTINDFTYVITAAEVCLTSETVTAISERLGVSPGWDMSGGMLTDGKLILPEKPHEAFADIETSAEDFRKAFFAVCNGKNDCAEVTVSVSLVYNGNTYKTYDAQYLVGFDSSTYGVAANDVQIGDGVILTD